MISKSEQISERERKITFYDGSEWIIWINPKAIATVRIVD